jgi:hypothetical protein
MKPKITLSLEEEEYMGMAGQWREVFKRKR